MAVLWHDGFDQYASATDATFVYPDSSGTVLDTSPVRTGRACYRANSTNNLFSKTLSSSYVTLITGVAVYFGNATTTTAFIRFVDTSTTHLYLVRTSTGELQVFRGDDTSLAVTSGLGLLDSTWYYIEFKATIDNSAGAFEVRLNGTSLLSGSGVDTQNGGNASANKVTYFTTSNSSIRFDDLYISDTSGAAPNNDFLGDVKVITLLPDGAGNYTQWTPSAGSNYQNVDDASGPDGDTTYNSSSTAAQKDTYTLGAVGQTGTIYNLMVGSYARKDDAGSRTARNLIRTNSVDAEGSNFSLLDSYFWNLSQFEKNPDTNDPWTVSNVDALEVGIELVS